MAYTKHTWKERLGTGLNKFKDTITGTIMALVNQPDSVTQEGTPVRADWLNEMEEGIYQAHETADAAAPASSVYDKAAADDRFHPLNSSDSGVSWVAGDLLAYALAVPDGLVRFFVTQPTTTNIPPEGFSYAPGIILARSSRRRVVVLFNNWTNDIIVNHYLTSAWSGWRKPSASDAGLLEGLPASAFATAAQGTKADNALPADATAVDSDKLDGLHASAFATAAQGTKADNALPVSAATPLPSVDLNNVRGPGFYSWGSTPVTANHPIGTNTTYGYLIIISRSTNQITQIYISSDGKVFYRQMVNAGNWFSWRYIGGANYGSTVPSLLAPGQIFVKI